MNLNGLIVDKIVLIVVELLIIFRLEDSAKLRLSYHISTTSVTLRSILS